MQSFENWLESCCLVIFIKTTKDLKTHMEKYRLHVKYIGVHLYVCILLLLVKRNSPCYNSHYLTLLPNYIYN